MVFGLFSKDKALKKTIERANNVMSQSADRRGAMEKLRDVGSDEALDALCRRFSFTYDRTIEDQQEKDWTVASLISLGEAALGPLRRHMGSAKNLGYPLKALGQMTTEATIFEVIDELLGDEEPGYVRDPKRRIDIIEWLGEWTAKPADIVSRVLPYVEDFDENVRMKSLEVISLKPDASAAETICRAMLREEEESKRFKIRCAEVLAEQGWPVASHKAEVKALLPKLGGKFRISGDTLVTES
ncbi:MAG: hypothetical protein GY811_05470 [Myxococcales bacterium]|nr:hypothetical protein [Myxococcales bacterium]